MLIDEDKYNWTGINMEAGTFRAINNLYDQRIITEAS